MYTIENTLVCQQEPIELPFATIETFKDEIKQTFQFVPLLYTKPSDSSNYLVLEQLNYYNFKLTGKWNRYKVDIRVVNAMTQFTFKTTFKYFNTRLVIKNTLPSDLNRLELVCTNKNRKSTEVTVTNLPVVVRPKGSVVYRLYLSGNKLQIDYWDTFGYSNIKSIDMQSISFSDTEFSSPNDNLYDPLLPVSSELTIPIVWQLLAPLILNGIQCTNNNIVKYLQ